MSEGVEYFKWSKTGKYVQIICTPEEFYAAARALVAEECGWTIGYVEAIRKGMELERAGEQEPPDAPACEVAKSLSPNGVCGACGKPLTLDGRDICGDCAAELFPNLD
jgi:hypothetical protein